MGQGSCGLEQCYQLDHSYRDIARFDAFALVALWADVSLADDSHIGRSGILIESGRVCLMQGRQLGFVPAFQGHRPPSFSRFRRCAQRARRPMAAVYVESWSRVIGKRKAMEIAG